MSEGNCSHCGQTFPVRSLFDLNGATFCESCVKVASKEARERRLPSLYMPLISKSICARCNTYIGSASDAMQVAIFGFAPLAGH
jgi:hypothetical protein